MFAGGCQRNLSRTRGRKRTSDMLGLIDDETCSREGGGIGKAESTILPQIAMRKELYLLAHELDSF